MAEKIYKFKSKAPNLFLLDLGIRFQKGYFETTDSKLQKTLAKRKGIEEIKEELIEETNE
ncbi:MAG: hypothetical protein RR795_01250 [Cetobacterium sp.]|uniref:hypothetical protein n=1 Tax=Cetobacterium sp. TaxID=2071632 RepID=UPI002FC8955D